MSDISFIILLPALLNAASAFILSSISSVILKIMLRALEEEKCNFGKIRSLQLNNHASQKYALKKAN